jgi:Ca2+-binding EF-hand superfamily protein
MDSDDSGYISAENLKEMLGAEFPQDEIDAIIKEVDITKNGKISYSEFLAMWEIQHEEKRSGEIMAIRNLLHYSDSDRSGDSVASSNEDVISRANFIDAKLHADAKTGETAAQIEKHVVFKDDTVLIN